MSAPTIESSAADTVQHAKAHSSPEGPPPLGSCPVCCEPIMEDAPFAVGACGHTFCHPCATKHVISSLVGKSYPAPCPARGACSAKLSHDECAQLLSHQHEWVSGNAGEVKTAWQVLKGCELRRTVAADRLCSCPRQGCEELIVVDYPWKMRDQPVRCPECDTALCAHCRTEWHHGFTCQEFKALPDDVKRQTAAAASKSDPSDGSKQRSKTGGQQQSRSRAKGLFRRLASRCLR